MKQNYYLLFLYGDLGSGKEFAAFVDSLFESLTDHNVKYVHDRHSAICHFQTRENLESITEFLNYVLDERVYTFFIFERPHKMGVRLDEDFLQHILQLDVPTSIAPTDWNPNDILQDEDFLEWYNQEVKNLGFERDFPPPGMDEEDSLNDVKHIRQNYREPLQMDTILDKISVNGVESLTNEEKNYLKNLSKSK